MLEMTLPLQALRRQSQAGSEPEISQASQSDIVRLLKNSILGTGGPCRIGVILVSPSSSDI